MRISDRGLRIEKPRSAPESHVPDCGSIRNPGSAIRNRMNAGRGELRTEVLWLIASRAVILFVGLNVAEALGLLPPRVNGVPFLPLLNLLTLVLTLIYTGLWWSSWNLQHQLRLQVGIDLCLATLLVAQTNGVESALVSLYVLIIIYCSLTMGRNAGMIGAALSTILYAGIIAAGQTGIISAPMAIDDPKPLIYRATINAFAFFAVAFLGTTLSRRLHAVQDQLQQKIYSLEQLQSLNEHIVSSIRSGLITTDLEGKVAVFNSMAEELTERQSAKVLGRPVRIVTGDVLWEKILSADFFVDVRPLRYQDWFELPGGKKRFLGFSVSPLVDQKQLLGYIMSFQDLTEIKRLEEEVRVRDRMAAAGRMAAGIAHEIRNPLTSMRGSVEILRSRDGLSHTERRLLDILIRESDRLNKFVEDFLQFARPARHTKQPVDLAQLLADSATLLRNSPEVRQKHAVVLKLERQPILISANEDQLRQVFWNLAQNALRAMPKGGTLTVSARPAPDGRWEVTFEDTGVGMTAEEKEQLFQPFHSGFSRGTGLGLSIVFQIIEDLRGRISIDSEKGHGTRVTLVFPPN